MQNCVCVFPFSVFACLRLCFCVAVFLCVCMFVFSCLVFCKELSSVTAFVCCFFVLIVFLCVCAFAFLCVCVFAFVALVFLCSLLFQKIV